VLQSGKGAAPRSERTPPRACRATAARLDMSGKVEFGVISQAAVAFSAIVAAFSLVVTQFQSLSNYAAVTERLSAMVQLTEGAHRADEKESANLYGAVLECGEHDS
jgi:ABC-type uncharacterized transport system fused permease/ATPase subunit